MDPTRRRTLALVSTAPIALTLGGCLDAMVRPEAEVDRGLELQLPPYDGPRARTAVTDFDWNVGSSRTTVGVGGRDYSFSKTEYAGYSAGLKDMLTTALVQSGRYRVLERKNIDSIKTEIGLSEDGYTNDSGRRRGNVQGVDIAVVAAVTGWDPGTKGAGGSIGGLLGKRAGALLGAVSGGYTKSSIAMDIRLVDAATTEILAATTVRGTAADVNIGGALGALTGSGGLGGSLGSFASTPMEKAIRTCIYEATTYIAANTPQSYMRY